MASNYGAQNLEQYCSEWLMSCLEIIQEGGKNVLKIKGEILSELLFRQYDRDELI